MLCLKRWLTLLIFIITSLALNLNTQKDLADPCIVQNLTFQNTFPIINPACPEISIINVTLQIKKSLKAMDDLQGINIKGAVVRIKNFSIEYMDSSKEEQKTGSSQQDEGQDLKRSKITKFAAAYKKYINIHYVKRSRNHGYGEDDSPYFKLVITFDEIFVMEQSEFLGIQDLQIINENLKGSASVSETGIIAESIIFYVGSLNLADSSQIVSSDYKCKTSMCICTEESQCEPTTFYDIDDPSYLSLLPFATSTTFNLPEAVEYYKAASSLDLLMYQIDASNHMSFELVIFSYNPMILNSSILDAPNIGIYSSLLSLYNNSIITSTGRGCSSSVGRGCGIYDTSLGLYQCGGSGGSYGGQGGNPMSLNYADDISCNEIESRYLYGNPINPIFEGSGGGSESIISDTYDSAGGGVVYIETVQQTVLFNSFIESNGKSNFQFDRDSGGGSGGSIQIHSPLINGTNSFITANGGGAMGSGGSGSGGRILLNITQWQNVSLWQDQSADNMQVQVYPGIIEEWNQKMQNSKQVYSLQGQNGTIMTTPCPSQFQIKDGYRCSICPAGTYKTFIGWGMCQPCLNKPDNSEPLVYGPNVSLSNAVCQFQCLNSTKTFNQKCLSGSEYIVAWLGGWRVIIPSFTFLICLASLVLMKTVRGKKRRRSLTEVQFQQVILNNNNNNNNNINPSISNYDEVEAFQEESQQRPDFHVEDLPYYMKRVYLHGENTHKKPWKINVDDNDFEMEDLAAGFNEMSKYSQLQTRLLLLLKLIYIVSYFWASRYMKQLKLVQLKKLIHEHIVQKKQYSPWESADQFKFKLSTSSDLTLAFIDIFDYNKTVYDWQYKTNYPVCLVLAGKGSFISPFHIQVEDPLCKSLYFTFQQRDTLEENIESNPSIMRFEKFLKKFNMLAKLIDYSCREKTFLRHFSELVKYVDNTNKKFFSMFGVEADICIHKLVRDKYATEQENNKAMVFPDQHSIHGHLQSRIIMLSYKDQVDLVNCLKDTHYLKNYSKYYEIKISLNFYQMSKVIHNDQVEIKTENNINKQIETYINYEQETEEIPHLMDKMRKRNYTSVDRPNDDFIPKPQRIQNIYDHHHHSDSTLDDNKCLWVSLLLFYLSRIFGVFKSSFLTYRKTQLSPNVLSVFILITIILHFISVISTFISFKTSQVYKVTEIIMILLIYPLCFAISPLIMIVWLVKHTERIGKNFMLFNYNAFYTQIIILIFGLLDLVAALENQDTLHVLISIAKMLGIVSTWLMSYFGSAYILLQEML